MAIGQQNPGIVSSSSQKTAPIWPDFYTLADEGSFFIATNPTVGTPIAMTTSVVDDAATASSTHAQYSPVMFIQNNWSPSDTQQKCIYIKYLKMILSQVPSSATSWQYAIRLDNNQTRLTTAASVIAPVNPNTNSGQTSKAYISFGANVTTLPTQNQRLVSRGQINSAVPVTLDQWFFKFGGNAVNMDQVSGGSGAKNISMPNGPIILAPGWSMTLEMWGASNAAAPSWEFELGYAERPAGL